LILGFGVLNAFFVSMFRAVIGARYEPYCQAQCECELLLQSHCLYNDERNKCRVYIYCLKTNPLCAMSISITHFTTLRVMNSMFVTSFMLKIINAGSILVFYKISVAVQVYKITRPAVAPNHIMIEEAIPWA